MFKTNYKTISRTNSRTNFKISQGEKAYILSPVVQGRKGEHKTVLEELKRRDFSGQE